MAKRKVQSKVQKVYMVIHPVLGDTFAFHAENEEDAQDKIWKWNKYHSFRGADAVHAIREVTDVHPDRMHDEYMRYM